MSEEYLKLARSVEKKCSRDLQNERDLRLRLQETMEAMANQMHGLESDAQRSVEDRPRAGSQGSREVPFSPFFSKSDSRGERASMCKYNAHMHTH